MTFSYQIRFSAFRVKAVKVVEHSEVTYVFDSLSVVLVKCQRDLSGCQGYMYCVVQVPFEFDVNYGYRPPTKLREGNVFTLCAYVCARGSDRPVHPLPMMHWTSLYLPHPPTHGTCVPTPSCY